MLNLIVLFTIMVGHDQCALIEVKLHKQVYHNSI